MTTNATGQKVPEWWDTFIEAVCTQTLDYYECQNKGLVVSAKWGAVRDNMSAIYSDPSGWLFRKRARMINIDGVELVAPVKAHEIANRRSEVWTITTGPVNVGYLDPNELVFEYISDRDAMRNALLGVKP